MGTQRRKMTVTIGVSLLLFSALCQAQSIVRLDRKLFPPGAEAGHAATPAVSPDGSLVVFSSDSLAMGTADGSDLVFWFGVEPSVSFAPLPAMVNGTIPIASHSFDNQSIGGAPFDSRFSAISLTGLDSVNTKICAVTLNLKQGTIIPNSDVVIFPVSEHSAGSVGTIISQSRNGFCSKGIDASYSSGEPDISDDGNSIVFVSDAVGMNGDADSCATDDPGSSSQIYFQDITGLSANGNRRLLSTSDGLFGFGDGSSRRPSISAGGRYVAFDTDAGNLDTDVPDELDSMTGKSKHTDIVVVDRLHDTRILIRPVSITDERSNNDSLFPAISGQGRYLAFETQATNLVVGATLYCDRNIVWMDRDINANGNYEEGPTDWEFRLVTTRVPGYSGMVNCVGMEAIEGAPTISDDGRYVAFASPRDDLVMGTTGQTHRVYVRDMLVGCTYLVSSAFGGGDPDHESYRPTISGDGRWIVFESRATNLTDSSDLNGREDVFLASTPCAADFNRDGFVTGDDFDAFVEAFENGEPSADINCDGFVTGDDFDIFVAIFALGC